MTDREKTKTGRGAATEGGHLHPAATPRNAGQALLAAALTGRGMTVRAFAARSGLPRSSVGEWLRGAKVPSLDHRSRLESELGVPATSWDLAPMVPSLPPGEGSPVDPTTAMVAELRSLWGRLMVLVNALIPLVQARPDEQPPPLPPEAKEIGERATELVEQIGTDNLITIDPILAQKSGTMMAQAGKSSLMWEAFRRAREAL